jgi:hypothetical protein
MVLKKNHYTQFFFLNGSGRIEETTGIPEEVTTIPEGRKRSMATPKEARLTPAKRKRLLKTFGPCPAGYTHKELELFLDLLYGMYSSIQTLAEIHQIVVSDPFDRSDSPRHIKLVDLTDWLEAVVA